MAGTPKQEEAQKPLDAVHVYPHLRFPDYDCSTGVCVAESTWVVCSWGEDQLSLMEYFLEVVWVQ